MSDYSPATAPKSQKASATAPTASATASHLGIDLGDYQLSKAACDRSNNNRSLIRGLELYLYPQCSMDGQNTPLLSIPCEYQTKEGITWAMEAETGEIETNCPGTTRKYMKKEMMKITVSINALALNDDSLLNMLQGRITGKTGNMRSIGFGAIRSFIIALVDRESGTVAIYPDVQYVPGEMSIKYSYDSEPSTELTFEVSKADIGDGEPFFYEVRTLEPKAVAA